MMQHVTRRFIVLPASTAVARTAAARSLGLGGPRPAAVMGVMCTRPFSQSTFHKEAAAERAAKAATVRRAEDVQEWAAKFKIAAYEGDDKELPLNSLCAIESDGVSFNLVPYDETTSQRIRRSINTRMRHLKCFFDAQTKSLKLTNRRTYHVADILPKPLSKQEKTANDAYFQAAIEWTGASARRLWRLEKAVKKKKALRKWVLPLDSTADYDADYDFDRPKRGELYDDYVDEEDLEDHLAV